MERFGIDNYLYTLAKYINNDKRFNYINFYNSFNIKVSDLRKQLDLYSSLNLHLQNVLVKYRGKVTFTNPKNIKIIIGKECNGIDISHLYRYIVQYGDNPELFDAVHEYVFINTLINYSAYSSYLHEIMHTQIVLGKNLEDQDNEELLPMFIEFIYGYVNNTDQLLYKMKRLSTYIDGYMHTTSEQTRNDTRRYIISTLKAIKLYHLYMNSNGDVCHEIANDITSVFKYEKVLEEVLDKYDITFENSKVDIKKLIKK